METKKDHLFLDAIPHLFLPKKTPEHANPLLSEIEQFILQSMKLSTSHAIRESEFNELDELKYLLERWELLQRKSTCPMEAEQFTDNFVQAVKSLSEPSNLSSATSTTIPIYIRGQNATILLNHQHDGSIQVETFRAALPSELVMSCVGPLTMNFPERREVIQNRELISSRAFAKCLHQLAVEPFEISTPSIQKCTQGDTVTVPDEREVAEPILINDWIVAVLSPSSTLKPFDLKGQITKKVRDQVTLAAGSGSSSLLPFRRSGIWMSIKVTLQLKLIKLLQNDTVMSKLVYKLLILRFLADMCKKYHEQMSGSQTELDLAAQMLAKLGRRVHKLGKIIPLPTMPNGVKIAQLKSRTLEHVQNVVSDLHQFCKDTIFGKSEDVDDGEDETYCTLPTRSHEEYLNDLDHTIPYLNTFKETDSSPRQPNPTDNTSEILKSKGILRYPSLDKIMAGASVLGEKCSLKERIWLHDTETFMKTLLKEEPDTRKIRDLVHTYVTHALKLHNGNPLGISQMVLVTLKAVEILFRRATGTHPIVLNYGSGINRGTFDCLILPHADDMKLLKGALDYFQCWDRPAPYKANMNILAGNNITENSFPVRFAAQDDGMTTLRNLILAKTEKNISRKLAEVERARKECRDLMSQIETLQMETEKGLYTLQHFLTCSNRLQERLNTFKTQFSQFERPLPTQEYLQNAVVFEILIPDEISSLRDCLAILLFGILEDQSFNTDKNYTSIEWMDYHNLIEHLPNQYYQYRLRCRNKTVINLGSKCLTFSQTLHSRSKPDILCCTDKMLVWDNGLQCMYSYSFVEPLKNLRNLCTFQINSTDNPRPYQSLQKYLKSFTHSQNTVIANQQECDVNLTLDEFLTFGSIRAGHRIQLKNLYRAIASRQLSLEEEPVLALILQTIWQMGPQERGSGSREAHLDFEEVGFSSAFLDMVDGLVQENRLNYSHPLIMMTAVVIAVRISELNENEGIRSRCWELLRSWRLIMEHWAKTLEVLLLNETDPDPTNLKELQKTLMVVRISTTLSYNFSNGLTWEQIMPEEKDLTLWFHAIAGINQLEEDEGVSLITLSGFMQLLLNVGKNVALRLRLEEHLGVHPVMAQAFHAFVTEKWGTAQSCNQPTIYYGDPSQKNIIKLEYTEKAAQVQGEQLQKYFIHFDFILGTFLVNGYPEGRLPDDVTSAANFKRYFLQNTRFRVHKKESPTVWTTVNKFHGKQYAFKLIERNEWMWSLPSQHRKKIPTRCMITVPDVAIKEIWDDGTKLTLIDADNLKDIVNSPFVRNFTHWFDPVREILYLRNIPSQDSDYDLPHAYKLGRMAGSDKWLFYDEGNHSQIFSIKSEIVKNVTGMLKRLEMDDHINLTMDIGSHIVTAHLPRFNLRLVVKDDFRLECAQYPGLYLTGKDFQDTLIGLQHGFQLQSKYKRLLIIPNDSIHTRSSAKGPHHNTEIWYFACLQQRSYFAYEFDDVLKRLVAVSKCRQAWLYLAALHAVTSTPLPDPFTGVTGTEMAVRILQSGSVWSSAPFDKESRKILNFIKGLSPKRSYYGHRFLRGQYEGNKGGSMEMIEWPEVQIPSMSAFDGYGIIVDKLIEDSQRLEILYYVDKEGRKNAEAGRKVKDDRPSSDKLQLRSYFRHLGFYNPGAAVEQHYFRKSLLNDNISTSRNLTFSKMRLTNGEEVSLAGVAQLALAMLPSSNGIGDSYKKFIAKDNLLQLLFLEYELPVLQPLDSWRDIFSMKFKQGWFTLYNMATKKNKSEEDKHNFTLILSSLAYRKVPLSQILNLHYISLYSDQVDFPLPPEEFPNPPGPSQNPTQLSTLPGGSVVSIIERNIINYIYIGTVSQAMGITESELKVKINAIATALQVNYWPCQSFPATLQVLSMFPSQFNLVVGRVLSQISSSLQQWYLPEKLRSFIMAVQANLNGIYDMVGVANSAEATCYGNELTVKVDDVDFKLGIQLESLVDINKLNKELRNEAEIYFKSDNKTSDGSEDVEGMSTSTLYSKVNKIMKNLHEMVAGNTEGNILHLTGMLPRLSPTSLLNHITQRNMNNRSNNACKIIQTYSGALAVLWTRIKRLNRRISYLANSQLAELEQEMNNVSQKNWKPQDFPEWLLLELELDITIRPIQVEVAQHMMKMPKGGNGVMQLNMGEGKTSVIVPMICSILGSRDDIVCRVTVLSSMFNMNCGILSSAIGGLLNKRLYSFPCKRDMKIDLECVDAIQQVYEECLKMNGVVITQPDYRLSFRLLAYDNILKKELSIGLKLMETENWLRDHARDILDESDELLNVKYQLVYTVGEQIPMDGGELRWTVCQTLLKIVHEVGAKFLKKCGADVVELDKDEYNRNKHQFTPIRLLDDVVHREFISEVADQFLEMVDETTSDKEKLKRFMTQENIGENYPGTEEILQIVRDTPGLANKILIVSGYLRRGVLTLGLSKRWRVEYGINPSNPKRQMAVPFRAKDVPAERAEFGHPDLAILLTHLSYYYSGLTDKQLEEVLKILKMKLDAEAIYNSWIHGIPNLPKYLRKYRGLNLKDSFQRSRLFELLRKHKLVIDLWLSNKVFSREAKQFPAKIVMTSWDLCYERGTHPVTGFSGTNDSSILLPLAISQHDMKSLQDTNTKVEGILLQPENQDNRKLEMGVTCLTILEKMKQDRLTVLIDTGAIMLECDNDQVATIWLQVNVALEAVLYFNRSHELMVKRRTSPGQNNRNSKDIPFALSSFQNRLGSCGVFLDDQHTRGTDLKFPVGTRACVTVGGDMKRDKLIQACMRMRKLGDGHSVTFYLSHEAYHKVVKGSRQGNVISTENILKWVKKNTKEYNQVGLLYWAIAGKNYAQRLAADDNFYRSQSCTEFQPGGRVSLNHEREAEKLGNQCVDDEFTSLMSLYGQYGHTKEIMDVIKSWFNSAIDELTRKNNGCQLPISIRENFDKIREQVVKRCKDSLKDTVYHSGMNLEEQQERELEIEKEMEVEQEQIIELRGLAQAAKNNLHENVVKIVTDGEAIERKDGIMRLCDMFKDTTFWGEVQPEGWGNEVFATTDFVTVINDTHAKTDLFIRPIEWVISGKRKGDLGGKLLVLSSFEVNELLPQFRRDNVACRLHMFSLRRSEQQNLLINESRLMLPKGCNPSGIPTGSSKVAALLLASGNLYFETESMEEQRAFARFLSLAPQPWSPAEQEAFDKGWITKAKFIKHEHREIIVGEVDGNGSPGFRVDPSELVRKILKCKHQVVSDKAHVVRLVNEKRYVDISLSHDVAPGEDDTPP